MTDPSRGRPSFQLRAIASGVFWVEMGVLILAWAAAYMAHRAFVPFAPATLIGLATGLTLAAAAGLALSGPWAFLAPLDAQFPEAATFERNLHSKFRRVLVPAGFALLLGFWAGSIAIPELWTIAFGVRGEHTLHVAGYEPAWRTVCEHIDFQETARWSLAQDLCLGQGHPPIPPKGSPVMTIGRASDLGVTIERYAFTPAPH